MKNTMIVHPILWIPYLKKIGNSPDGSSAQAFKRTSLDPGRRVLADGVRGPWRSRRGDVVPGDCGPRRKSGRCDHDESSVLGMDDRVSKRAAVQGHGGPGDGSAGWWHRD